MWLLTRLVYSDCRWKFDDDRCGKDDCQIFGTVNVGILYALVIFAFCRFGTFRLFLLLWFWDSLHRPANKNILARENEKKKKGGGGRVGNTPSRIVPCHHQTKIESDLSHLGDLSDIFCGHFDEKKNLGTTLLGARVCHQRPMGGRGVYICRTVIHVFAWCSTWLYKRYTGMYTI